MEWIPGLDDQIRQALAEDRPYRDIASEAILDQELGEVDLIAKATGVICGLAVFQRVFELLSDAMTYDLHCAEGDRVESGQVLMTLQGPARDLLVGERVALNYLQRLSGIATTTRRFVDALAGSSIKLMDTRKTTPGMRQLEKYAVSVGGGYNHRFSLSDLIMLKDNHVAAAGGITEAVAAVRRLTPFTHKIEVETESLEMVREAVACHVDIIMLDNMTTAEMAEAIDYIDGRAIVEGSGNMTLDRLPELLGLKLDYISAGALTHSAGILDLSMKHFRLLRAE